MLDRHPYRSLATLPQRRRDAGAGLCALMAWLCWLLATVTSAVALVAVRDGVLALARPLVALSVVMTLGGAALEAIARSE